MQFLYIVTAGQGAAKHWSCTGHIKDYVIYKIHSAAICLGKNLSVKSYNKGKYSLSSVHDDARKHLLEEVGDVVAAAAGPGEWLAVLGQLCSHDTSWLMTRSSTHITWPVVLHPKTAAARNSTEIVAGNYLWCVVVIGKTKHERRTWICFSICE